MTSETGAPLGRSLALGKEAEVFGHACRPVGLTNMKTRDNW